MCFKASMKLLCLTNSAYRPRPSPKLESTLLAAAAASAAGTAARTRMTLTTSPRAIPTPPSTAEDEEMTTVGTRAAITSSEDQPLNLTIKRSGSDDEEDGDAVAAAMMDMERARGTCIHSYTYAIMHLEKQY